MFAFPTFRLEAVWGKSWRGGKTPEWEACDEATACPLPAPPLTPFLGAKCALPLIQVILMEQKMYTSGAALQLCLHCAFLFSFAEPWVTVKLTRCSQLKHVQWQLWGLCFILLHGILDVLCKTILRRPGFCEYLKQLERVFLTSLLITDHIFSWFASISCDT